MIELLLVAAGVIIAVIVYLYFREKMVLKSYYELLEERGKIDKLSRQVQLDYYKRRMTEETLRKVLDDYHGKSRELDLKISEIEKKHGINKNMHDRHQEREADSKGINLEKTEGEIK